MSVIDMILGRESLRRQRDSAIRGVEEQFDPQIVQPQIDVAQRRIDEGIEPEADIARTGFLTQAFAGEEPARLTGGSQAGAIATGQATTEARGRALGELERNLATQDIAARREGEVALAEGQTRQAQIRGQRAAGREQAQAMFEAEMSRRRQGLLSTALGVAGTIATTPIPGAGGAMGLSLAERGLQAVFGGDEEGVAGFETPEVPEIAEAPALPDVEVPSMEPAFEGRELVEDNLPEGSVEVEPLIFQGVLDDNNQLNLHEPFNEEGLDDVFDGFEANEDVIGRLSRGDVTLNQIESRLEQSGLSGTRLDEALRQIRSRVLRRLNQ